MSLCRALFVELLPITIRFKCEQRFRHVHYELWMMLAASLEWAGRGRSTNISTSSWCRVETKDG
jgi:hypothetical protein